MSGASTRVMSWLQLLTMWAQRGRRRFPITNVLIAQRRRCIAFHPGGQMSAIAFLSTSPFQSLSRMHHRRPPLFGWGRCKLCDGVDVIVHRGRAVTCRLSPTSHQLLLLSCVHKTPFLFSAPRDETQGSGKPLRTGRVKSAHAWGRHSGFLFVVTQCASLQFKWFLRLVMFLMSSSTLFEEAPANQAQLHTPIAEAEGS